MDGPAVERSSDKLETRRRIAIAADNHVDSLLFTQFCDKITLIRKSERFTWSKGKFRDNMNEAQALRDNLAHANEYAATREFAAKVCNTVRLMEHWIALLSHWPPSACAGRAVTAAIKKSKCIGRAVEFSRLDSSGSAIASWNAPSKLDRCVGRQVPLRGESDGSSEPHRRTRQLLDRASSTGRSQSRARGYAVHADVASGSNQQVRIRRIH